MRFGFCKHHWPEQGFRQACQRRPRLSQELPRPRMRASCCHWSVASRLGHRLMDGTDNKFQTPLKGCILEGPRSGPGVVLDRRWPVGEMTRGTKARTEGAPPGPSVIAGSITLQGCPLMLTWHCCPS